MTASAQLSSALAAWNPSPEIQIPFASSFSENMAAGGIQQQQVGWSAAAVTQKYMWQSDSLRKPPAREGSMSVSLALSHEFLQASFSQLSADIESIKAQYVLRNARAIAHFFSTHRSAVPFLSRALPELKQSFGDGVIFNLEALTEDDKDSTTLYAIAVWRGQAERADAALQDFDERWWLNQTPQPGIIFTYELA